MDNDISREEKREWRKKLLDAITRVHQVDCLEHDCSKVFEKMLEIMLDVTQSEHGFIGSVVNTGEGLPCVKAHAVTIASWKEDIEILFECNAGQPVPSDGVKGLFGKILREKQQIIDNEFFKIQKPPYSPDHPHLKNFLGMPMFAGTSLVGILGVANRAEGFSEKMIEDLDPLIRTVSQMIHARTERKQRLDAEVHLLSIVEAIQESIISISEQGVVTTMNLSARKLFEVPIDEQFESNLRSDKPLEINEFIDSIDGKGGSFSEDLEGLVGQVKRGVGRKRDGATFPLEVSLSKGYHGKVLFYVAIMRDITDKLEAEARLKKSEERWLYALSGNEDGVWVWDVKNNEIAASDSWFKMFGYDPTEVYDMVTFWVSLIHEDDKAEVNRLATEHLTGKSSQYYCEHRMRCKDGSYRWVLCRGKVISFNADGSAWKFVGTTVNINQKKENEAALIAAKEAAERASKAKAAFLATMSHEIRTPMNGVIGMTAVLLDTELSDDQRDKLTAIKESGDVLLQIINDILDYSKIESGKLEMERSKFDVLQAVERVAEMLIQVAESKGLDMVIHLEPDLPKFMVGDSGRTSQVLINLITNSIKFTTTGYVLVRVFKEQRLSNGEENDGHWLVLNVEDSGIGIPPEKQRGIFKHFTQVDASTTRKFGGTGLGLAISKQLVELMGGEISFSSKVGEGTIFSVKLPIVEERQLEGEPELPSVGLDGGGTISEWLNPSFLTSKVLKCRVLVMGVSSVTNNAISGVLRLWGVKFSCVTAPAEALSTMVGIKVPESVVLDEASLAEASSPESDSEPVSKLRNRKRRNEAMYLKSKNWANALVNASCDFSEAPESEVVDVLSDDVDVVIFDVSQQTLWKDEWKWEVLKNATKGGKRRLIILTNRSQKDNTEVGPLVDELGVAPVVLRKPMARPKALAAALECAIQPMGSPEVNVVDLKGKSFGPKKGHDNLSSAGGEFMCEKKVVLLVEDNHINQKVAMAMLKNLGVEVKTANNGLEAVTAVQRSSFDLVLMDCQMPDMDGWEATKKIRELELCNGVQRPVPIIALTANALKGDKEKCLEAGMSDYLSKPVSKASLQRVLGLYCSEEETEEAVSMAA